MRLRWSGGVTAGHAEIHSQGDLTTITQSSQNAAINWQSFSVAPQETVQFKQPNSDSITLNRVTGNEASDIQGQIKANGHIFISNPNGVLIGNNAQINVGGLVATTQKISDEDFMANRFNFTGEGKGVVENRGHIQVPKGGVVALVAPIVKNSGKITALQANTLLASAEHFSITLPSNNKFSYQISKGTLQGLVDNGGAILADGGYVVLTAKGLSAVKKSVINHSGTIQANTVSNKNGKIELLGDLDNSQLNVAGKLIAEAPNGGDGGFIETSAAKVKIDDNVKVSTKSTKGSSGTWLIDPNDFVIGGKNADMTANTLSRQLDNGNVNIKSTNGKAEGKGDIIINKQVNWNKNKLTLSAQNDILINKTLNGTGTASLVMEYGLATSDGGESDFYLQKYVPLAERTAAINLPEGKNLRVRKGSEGEFTTFDVIHKMPEILEDGTNAEFPSNHIALGQDIDLSYTKTLNNPKFGGWKDKTGYFNQNANFWGLGHKVKNLYINATEVTSSNVGFLTDTYASIRDIGVEGEISSNTTVGGLAGSVYNNNYNYIKNSYTDMSITASNSVAGLIAYVHGNETNKTEISNVYSIGNITVNNNNHDRYIGGVFGYVHNTVIKDSYAKNKITMSNNDNPNISIGGFIASSENSTISNSYFDGDISLSSSEARSVGGLIGSSGGDTISSSYTNGHLLVSGSSGGYFGGIGGLLGYSSSSINNSYSSVTVNANESTNVGGLIGQSFTYLGTQEINNSYSSGLVIGKSSVGGLIGYNKNLISITNSYSTSNVRGKDSVGGLIGESYGSVNLTNVYSSGEVSGKRNVTGLYYASSSNSDDKVTNSYTQGDVKGEENVKRFIGSYNDKYEGTSTNSGVLDDDALKDKSSFKDWDFENVWEIKEGQYPTLRNVGVVTPEVPPAVEDIDEPEVPQPQPEIDYKPKALELLKSAALIRKNMQNKLTILANQGVDADIVSLNNNIANAKREAQTEIEKVTNSQDKLELNLQLEAITLLDDATINAAKQTAVQKRKEAEDKRLAEERKAKEEAERLANEEKLKADKAQQSSVTQLYLNALTVRSEMEILLKKGEIKLDEANRKINKAKSEALIAANKVVDESFKKQYKNKIAQIAILEEVKPVESPKPVKPVDTTDHKAKALSLIEEARVVSKNARTKLNQFAASGKLADFEAYNRKIKDAIANARAEIEKVTSSQDKLELTLQLDAIKLLNNAEINAAKQQVAQKQKEENEKRLEEERKQKEAARLEKERKEKAESDRLAQEAARIKAEKLKEDQKLKDAARDAYNKAFVTQKQMQARLNNGEISFGKASEQVAREKETARRAIEKVNDASYRSEYLAKLNSIKPLLEQNQPKVEDKPKEVVKRFITITARNLNKVYDGIAVTKDNISTLNGWGTYGYDYSGELDAGDNISSFGRISFDGDWQGKIDAGNYKLVPYGLSSSKYEFKYNPSNLVINPRTLTIHILDSFVDENRHADPSSVGVIAEGLVGNDEIHPPKLVIAHEVILNDPNSKVEFKKGKASNYDIEFKEGNMIYLPHDKTRYNFPTDDYIENHSTEKIIENYYELIKDKGDELFLADVVYDSDFGERRIELRNSYNKMEKIRLLDKKSIIASGLQMALYEVIKDGKSHYVFAYRGTSSLTDLGIDLLSGVFTSPQHNGSIDITKEMLKKIPNNSSINYVGHSLGGSLATINAYVFGGDSVTTFNPLGLNHATIDAVRRNHVIKPIKHSANFILGNDIVNTINQTVSSDGLLGGNEKYIPIGLIGFKWIVSNSIGNHSISSIDKNFTSIESLYHNYKLWNKPGVKKVRKPMLSSLYWSSEEKMPEKISISPSKMSKHVTVMKKDSNNIVGYLSKNAHYIQDNPINNHVKFIAVPVKFGSEALGNLFGALKKMNDIASLANKNDPHNLFASAVKKLGDNFVHNINRVQQDYRSKKISKKDAIDELTHIKLDTSKQFIEMRKDAENKGIFLYILDYIVSAPNDEMIRTFNWIEKEIKSINVNELLN